MAGLDEPLRPPVHPQLSEMSRLGPGMRPSEVARGHNDLGVGTRVDKGLCRRQMTKSGTDTHARARPFHLRQLLQLSFLPQGALLHTGLGSGGTQCDSVLEWGFGGGET